MNRDQFISRRRQDWERFEDLVGRAADKSVGNLSGEELADLSALYRALCFDLSLVQSRDWGTSMSRYLNNLVAQGHHVLYRSQPGSLMAILRFLAVEFPQLLRANGWYFLVALLLFVVPGVVAGTLAAWDPQHASRILPKEMQEGMESMYSTSSSERGGTGMEGFMAGFYVQHNVGISFRCFALGIFAGIGTIKELVFNSIVIGTITGFLIGRGHSHNFFEFVIGHGSFELTAIVISGQAGLILGHAVVHPGNRTRWAALRDRGMVAVKLALGAGAMLCVAAVIEGFWSPSFMPFAVKMVVGATLWMLVIAYLSLAGRAARAASALSPTTDTAA